MTQKGGSKENNVSMQPHIIVECKYSGKMRTAVGILDGGDVSVRLRGRVGGRLAFTVKLVQELHGSVCWAVYVVATCQPETTSAAGWSRCGTAHPCGDA